MLLTPQAAAQAAIQTDAELRQVVAQHFGLAHPERRQHVVVVGAEGGLAMSNQVDAAHVRSRSCRVEVSRGYGQSRAPVNEKTYACLKLREQMFPRLECGWQGLRGMGMLARYY